MREQFFFPSECGHKTITVSSYAAWQILNECCLCSLSQPGTEGTTLYITSYFWLQIESSSVFSWIPVLNIDNTSDEKPQTYCSLKLWNAEAERVRCEKNTSEESSKLSQIPFHQREPGPMGPFLCAYKLLRLPLSYLSYLQPPLQILF